MFPTLAIALLLLGAPPTPVEKALPRLELASPDAVQTAWTALKETRGLTAQLERLQKRRLDAMQCKDLVDIRALAVPGGPLAGIGFRDQIRERGWARPTLALLLSEAFATLRAEYPGRFFTVGDVAQPGCGQINHGVIVRVFEDARAEAFLKDATLHRGRPTVFREVRAGTAYPGEVDRFDSPDATIRVTTVALAASKPSKGKRQLRVAETRHIASPPPPPELEAELAQTFRRLGAKRHLVRRRDVDDARGKMTLWHFIDPAKSSQMEVLAARSKRLPGLDDALEVRLGRWQDKKVGSFPGEILWERGPSGWRRWVQVHEAGHITHLSGLDADLSYITRDNERHFAVDLEAMDVPATWRWFEILDETARRLKLQIEGILVDRSIRDHLRANLPMKGKGSVARHRVWSLLKISPGHDGHHHLRIAAPKTRAETAARKELTGR